jgi:hypothetical protein
MGPAFPLGDYLVFLHRAQGVKTRRLTPAAAEKDGRDHQGDR